MPWLTRRRTDRLQQRTHLTRETAGVRVGRFFHEILRSRSFFAKKLATSHQGGRCVAERSHELLGNGLISLQAVEFDQ